MKSKKVVSSLLVAAMATSLLAGCGGKDAHRIPRHRLIPLRQTPRLTRHRQRALKRQMTPRTLLTQRALTHQPTRSRH